MRPLSSLSSLSSKAQSRSLQSMDAFQTRQHPRTSKGIRCLHIEYEDVHLDTKLPFLASDVTPSTQQIHQTALHFSGRKAREEHMLKQ
ncbi:hypothetical protein AB6A40_001399 [Gnathostoma spinigerum]|uniref:Uncharacterized protein n=1 Tax=Gnathostoma spinigerum TaxID=75299 RepID=A0ABD6E436_9BILA